MSKALCYAGLAVAVLVLIMFGTDLAIQFPFGRVSMMMDIGFVICALLLGYLSWQTLREQR